MTWTALYLLLLRAAVTSFSGFASVPVIHDELVLHHRLLSDDQLNAALAISQTSPGPLGLYVVAVGYFVGGISGALAAICALATPAVLVIPILAASLRGRTEWIRKGSAAIVVASSALMAIAAIRLLPSATPHIGFYLLIVAGFAVLATGRLPPLYVVAVSGLAGLAL